MRIISLQMSQLDAAAVRTSPAEALAAADYSLLITAQWGFLWLGAAAVCS